MGAILSRIWSEITQFMGWGLVPTSYSLQRGSDAEFEDDELYFYDMDTEDGVEPCDELEETTVRKRRVKTPEKGQSAAKVQSASPTKSNWVDGAEHPKPKLDVVPPNKKTKTEEEGEKISSASEMQFESVPNIQFGNDECPESLLPDYLTTSMQGTHAKINGHFEGGDTPPEGSHLLLDEKNSNGLAMEPSPNPQERSVNGQDAEMSCGDDSGKKEMGLNGDAKTENPKSVKMQAEEQDDGNKESHVGINKVAGSLHGIPKIVVNLEPEETGEADDKKQDDDLEMSSNMQSENGNPKLVEYSASDSSGEKETSAIESDGDVREKTEDNSADKDEVIQSKGFDEKAIERENFDDENAENVDPNIQQKVNNTENSKRVSVQWTGCAGNVFITGSWLDWKDKIELQKSDENIWSADLAFKENVKEIELKFIVDGEWVISHDMPSVDDGSGNRNNYIKLLH